MIEETKKETYLKILIKKEGHIDDHPFINKSDHNRVSTVLRDRLAELIDEGVLDEFKKEQHNFMLIYYYFLFLWTIIIYSIFSQNTHKYYNY